jgi:hypothetical protein
MADTKISALTAGNPALGTDVIPVARAGTNVGVTATSIAALAGGGTYPRVGTPIISGPRCSGSTSGFNGYTIWAQLCGNRLRILPAAWKIVLAAVSGTGIHIAAASVLKTLPMSFSVISNTPVLFGGQTSIAAIFGTTPTATSPAFVTSDTVSLQLDSDHDYWVGYFLDADSAGPAGANLNGSIGLPLNSINTGVYGMYQGGGDFTGVTTITETALNIQCPGFWSFTFVS